MIAAESFLQLLIVTQGICIVSDEIFFHRRRELPRWERLGHPLDTLMFIAALAIPLMIPVPTNGARLVYIGLAFASCVCITKDEWIHTKLCPAGEHWLHAVMFILHGLIMLETWHLWTTAPTFPLPPGALVPIVGFMVYQVVYWNFWKRPVSKEVLP